MFCKLTFFFYITPHPLIFFHFWTWSPRSQWMLTHRTWGHLSDFCKAPTVAPQTPFFSFQIYSSNPTDLCADFKQHLQWISPFKYRNSYQVRAERLGRKKKKKRTKRGMQGFFDERKSPSDGTMANQSTGRSSFFRSFPEYEGTHSNWQIHPA